VGSPRNQADLTRKERTVPDRPSTAVQFTPYEISMCLYDVDRTRLWRQAIEDTVRAGDVVVDAGSGTGILGVFAALDGAARVYCIELHPRFCRLIEHLAERNGVADRVVVIQGDATRVELPEPVDVVICELLCTGQFFEPEVQVMNHLRRFMKPDVKIVPRRIESCVQLLDAQEELFDVRIDIDSRSTLLLGDEPISTRARYDAVDFDKLPVRERVESTVSVVARKSEQADSVLITSQATLTDDLVTERTRFLYNPEVVFLRRPLVLEKGRSYRVRIAYPYGCDTLDCEIEVQPDE